MYATAGWYGNRDHSVSPPASSRTCCVAAPNGRRRAAIAGTTNALLNQKNFVMIGLFFFPRVVTKVKATFDLQATLGVCRCHDLTRTGGRPFSMDDFGQHHTGLPARHYVLDGRGRRGRLLVNDIGITSRNEFLRTGVREK